MNRILLLTLATASWLVASSANLMALPAVPNTFTIAATMTRPDTATAVGNNVKYKSVKFSITTKTLLAYIVNAEREAGNYTGVGLFPAGSKIVANARPLVIAPALEIHDSANHFLCTTAHCLKITGYDGSEGPDPGDGTLTNSNTPVPSFTATTTHTLIYDDTPTLGLLFGMQYKIAGVIVQTYTASAPNRITGAVLQTQTNKMASGYGRGSSVAGTTKFLVFGSFSYSGMLKSTGP